ncbi:MAG: hypothetical protein H8E66_23915 [Planctomycetes bacterium]|nr:hypothetical protein [Planctomycetota bacterium]
MRRFLCILISALVVLPLLALADDDAPKKASKRGDAVAQRAESNKPSRGKKAAVKPMPPITSEQEAAAVALVKKHHNDLFELLIYLKENVAKEYERAIRDLSRASDRLAAIKKRDPQRFDIELRLWKAQSRRQLLTARLQMEHDDSLLKELRETLAEELKLELAILRHERERFAARVAKIDKQIETQKTDPKALVEKKFAALMRAAKISGRNVSSKKRKSAKDKDTKDPT